MITSQIISQILVIMLLIQRKLNQNPQKILYNFLRLQRSAMNRTMTDRGIDGTDASNMDHFPRLDSPTGMFESSEVADMDNVDDFPLFDSQSECQWIKKIRTCSHRFRGNSDILGSEASLYAIIGENPRSKDDSEVF